MIKKYTDVLLAALLALATGLFVPFSPALLWESINWNLLGILFCLMTITAEIGKWGIPRALCLHFFCGKVTVRQLARFFTGACFFSSMVITNDISLIIFVPFSISTFIEIHERSLLIPLITLETIAANMGSMLTPIGNPQNLFIYEYFHLPLSDFLSTTAPVVFISGFFLYLAGRLFPETVISSLPSREMELPRKKSLFLLFLLLLCVLHVLRLIPLALVMAVVVPAMIFLDRKAFWEVDYKLLLLFSLLFMAVGNLGRLDILSTWARQTIGAMSSGYPFSSPNLSAMCRPRSCFLPIRKTGRPFSWVWMWADLAPSLLPWPASFPSKPIPIFLPSPKRSTWPSFLYTTCSFWQCSSCGM